MKEPGWQLYSLNYGNKDGEMGQLPTWTPCLRLFPSKVKCVNINRSSQNGVLWPSRYSINNSKRKCSYYYDIKHPISFLIRTLRDDRLAPFLPLPHLYHHFTIWP